jgi:Flp pilus assembly protein TadG
MSNESLLDQSMSNRNRLSRVAARSGGKLAKKLAASCWQTLAQETRGQEIAEAALVLPIVFMVLIGIFWFGQAFRIYGTLAQAARVGVTAAANPICSTCTSGTAQNVYMAQNAYNAIQGTFNVAKLDTTKLQQPTTKPNLQSCAGNPGVVQCETTQTNICVQEGVQLTQQGLGGTNVCGVAVSFQYPYKFWFPGTWMNNQTLQLQGVAEARSETH